MFTFEINFVSFVPREERDYYEYYCVNNITVRKQTCLSLLYWSRLCLMKSCSPRVRSWLIWNNIKYTHFYFHPFWSICKSRKNSKLNCSIVENSDYCTVNIFLVHVIKRVLTWDRKQEHKTRIALTKIYPADHKKWFCTSSASELTLIPYVYAHSVQRTKNPLN